MTAVWAIVIFLVLVFVHELGHFLAAKASGVTVLEFALGMGPALFKKEWRGTVYSIRLLPIGGFCKLEGEDEAVQTQTEQDEEAVSVTQQDGNINNKPPMVRFFVMVSGALMNILLGFIVFLVILSSAPEIAVPVIGSVVPGSPAQTAGLQPGDQITAINGARVHLFGELSFHLSRYREGEIEIEYIRDGARQQAMLTPAVRGEGQYVIGFYPSAQTLTGGQRIETAYRQTVFMVKVTLVSFGDLITGRLNLDHLSGPVGIVGEINSAAKEAATEQDYSSLLGLAALITINLGVFNLLPLPALDGGRIVFVLLEAVRRKKVPPEKEGIVHAIGFMLLIGLMLFATWNDIARNMDGIVSWLSGLRQGVRP